MHFPKFEPEWPYAPFYQWYNSNLENETDDHLNPMTEYANGGQQPQTYTRAQVQTFSIVP